MRYLIIGLFILCIGGCTKNRVFEAYVDVQGDSWSLYDTLSFDVEVNDAGVRYNMFVNLRHTRLYANSNIWIRVFETNPGGETTWTRYEFTLAEPDGRWRGQGIGNFIDHHYLVKREFLYPSEGIYQYRIVHDMRQDEVRHVNSLGIRVDKLLNR